ncbi:branched-chain amino acid transport system II carrier protein [Aureisphaera sp. CAU 1614]|uniref:Branched-chain amino acid transport system II carrier protein n=1 Tax=Halomarinibacterium sedimenti TaxID=2857106 RepID=A0A9X1JY12_9FLAO|nr:branched-chain amino acid transport system II carrier protein [Halomarinibacterium sedimenti]MBW2937082.1 branched-chain amino acid transport system II carrier protein [Halomarinibacterium sedimenti]
MKHTKQTFIVAFALFSLFFGAGNLILPPFLGYNSGQDWFWVLLGFLVSAVVIPILAIYGHAKLQGSLLDFGKKVSSKFALLFAIIIYIISITLPSPRTASVTYEMAIAPYFSISSIWTSTLYFMLVLIFVLNRSKILNIVGKFLTPLIFIILFLIIVIGLSSEVEMLRASIFENNFTSGILEGYQTFDAIGGVVVGGVIVISLSFQTKLSFTEKKKIIGKAGLWAGTALFLMYAGLIALGAHYSLLPEVGDRAQFLTFVSVQSLGNIGTAFLAVLVALACFTTAVGIVTGTADFVKEITNQAPKAYQITAILGCILGVVMGQLPVNYIIAIAFPALMFIYPITIVLILLNVLPQNYTSKLIFRGVVLVTFLFSIPDFLGVILPEENWGVIKNFIPLAHQNMGWILPAMVTFILLNIIQKNNNSETLLEEN